MRNDAFDARNFFSQEVEPLKQHQFGATVGGPVQRERAFFFGYYEGFRNTQGITTSATVPTAAERDGDFSGLGRPLLNLAAGGVPFADNRVPAAAINPVARNVLAMYPLGNVSPSIYRETVIARNEYDQGGLRIDLHPSARDQVFGRYSYSGGSNHNPISVRGSDAPGFPTRDDFSTHSATISSTRILSPSLTNSLRGNVLRHRFFFDQRLNRTPPSALGFGYEPVHEIGQGPPFFNISGYTPIGGAITGPRNTTQRTLELQDSVSWARGGHLLKFGGEYLRTGIDMFQGIAPNAFFVFASTFPTNNAIANLLLGAPVTFYQGFGDFSRQVNVWNLRPLRAGRMARRRSTLTINYGVRYERINPLTEVQDRLNGFIPGMQSTVRPDAPRGLVFPGDPGVGEGIAHSAHAFMPRVGVAWDPAGDGVWSIRAGYGVFYDQFQNGAGTASQVAISAIPVGAVRPVQRRRPQLPESVRRAHASRRQHLRPAIDGLRHGRRQPAAVHAALECRRAAGAVRSLRGRGRATSAPRGRGCRAMSKPIRQSSVPGATAQNADRRRIHGNCPADGSACDFSTVAMITNIARSSYHGAADERLATLFHRTRLQRLVLAIADLRPSLGDESVRARPPSRSPARTTWRRIRSTSKPNGDRRCSMPAIASSPAAAGSCRRCRTRHPRVRAISRRLAGQRDRHVNSGTPFTVSDSANVALQANSPPISGFAASRPNLVGDPNAGPHTVDEWMSRSAFERLNVQTQAGQFGNAGRNIARGPGYANVDVSLVRDVSLPHGTRLQFRAEVFNVTNHVNLGLPVADLNSPNFGRIFSAGSAAADAVRGQVDVLSAAALDSRRRGNVDDCSPHLSVSRLCVWKPSVNHRDVDVGLHDRRIAPLRRLARRRRIGRRRVRQLRVAARLHVRHPAEAAVGGIRLVARGRLGGLRHRGHDRRGVFTAARPSARSRQPAARHRPVPGDLRHGVRLALAADAEPVAPLRRLLRPRRRRQRDGADGVFPCRLELVRAAARDCARARHVAAAPSARWCCRRSPRRSSRALDGGVPA